MPAKGKTKLTRAQKAAVIVGKAAGLTDKAAAAAAGISRPAVHKILKDPGTRDIFREAVAAHDAEIAGLISLLLKTLAEDVVSAQNEAQRTKLRDEGMRMALNLRQLGGFGMSAASGMEGNGSGAGTTLGDIFVRFSHTTTASSGPTTAHPNGSAAT